MVESGKKVSYKLQTGVLVLLPKDSWVEENCLKDEWGVHIEISDDEYMAIPDMWGDEPILARIFSDYYIINGNSRIEHS